MSKDKYPLKPYDSNGVEIKVGDKVKILRITDTLIHDLPKADQEALKAYEGKIVTISEIDSWGCMWFENFETYTDDIRDYRSFCLEPEVLEKVG
jgi:hypothetical protein